MLSSIALACCGACALLDTIELCLFLVAITNVTISFLPGESAERSASCFHLGAAGFLFRPDPLLLAGIGPANRSVGVPVGGRNPGGTGTVSGTFWGVTPRDR